MLLQPGKAGRHRRATCSDRPGTYVGWQLCNGRGVGWWIGHQQRLAQGHSSAAGSCPTVLWSPGWLTLPRRPSHFPLSCTQLNRQLPLSTLQGWGESLADGWDLPSGAHCHIRTLSASNVTKQGLREPPSSLTPPEALDARVSPPGARPL